MVVEPDILARMVLAEYLRDCGYKVLEGNCADDVFTVLRSDIKVHTVFAEVRLLGDSDGFALARTTREMYPEGVLKKPYHPDEIIRRINILRDRRAPRPA